MCGLQGAQCLFQELVCVISAGVWGLEEMGYKHNWSGCVTQDPRMGPMGACAIHPIHLFRGFHASCMLVLIPLVLGWGGVRVSTIS